MGGFAPKATSASYRSQEARETQSANNARQTDAVLTTTADMSSPQTYEAGVTRQPAESASRALSSGNSTTVESMDTDTGDLRHRATTRPTPSDSGNPTSSPEDLSKISASDELLAKAKIGRSIIVLEGEDGLTYAKRVVARQA